MSKTTWVDFRAYDKFTKKMWSWEDHNAFDTGKGSIRSWFRDSDLEPMLFTTLFDVNGKKIYEGDIVRRGPKMPDNLPREMQNIFTVVFDKGCFMLAEMKGISIGEGWGVKFVASAYESELEVLGNIYQNPKLLENK